MDLQINIEAGAWKKLPYHTREGLTAFIVDMLRADRPQLIDLSISITENRSELLEETRP